MITSILLNNEEFEQFKLLDENVTETKELENLSKINVFIGPNNSGKSRFLREIFKIDNLEFLSDNPMLNNFDEIIKEYIAYERKITSGISFEKEPNGFVREGLTRKTDFEDLVQRNNWNDELLNEAPHLIEFVKFIKYKTINLSNTYLYIPILRGLRPISSTGASDYFSSYDSYKIRSIKDYFKNLSNDGKTDLKGINKSIYTGLNIYDEIDTNKRGVLAKRNLVENFERFLSDTFFNKRKISLTAIKDSDVLSIHMEDETNERLIYEVGDGIQALITLLYPLYLNADKENTLVFIEEPELNLHPGMQRIFMDVLKSDDFKNFQFFFTTHSNHFLDMSFELESNISVYRFKKRTETEYEVKNLSSPDHNLLQDLGVRNSSVFLSNCTVWVEGITDRMYLKKFMEVYAKQHTEYQKYREDLHYAFVEYAGSNITHWDFSEESDQDKIRALSLNQNIFLIVDSDCAEDGTKKKEVRHKALQEELKDKLYITEGKEFENILSIDTINKVLKAYNENDSIEATENDFKFKNIGKFIDEKLSERKRTYQKDNSISDKLGFCEKAVKSITSIDDLSEEAKTLCEKIYKFVASHNQ